MEDTPAAYSPLLPGAALGRKIDIQLKDTMEIPCWEPLGQFQSSRCPRCLSCLRATSTRSVGRRCAVHGHGHGGADSQCCSDIGQSSHPPTEYRGIIADEDGKTKVRGAEHYIELMKIIIIRWVDACASWCGQRAYDDTPATDGWALPSLLASCCCARRLVLVFPYFASGGKKRIETNNLNNI